MSTGITAPPERSVLERAAVVAALREIAALLALQGASKFKVRAFERGAASLEATPAPFETLGEEQLLALPRVGFALAGQILELRDTGRSELLDSLKAGLPSGVLELSQVSGIGLHALRVLHSELGIANIGDLRVAAETGRLRTVEGFGEKREAKVLAAIERYETKPTLITLADGRHPIFKIWGHPLGRLVTSRPPIAIRMEEVLDALAESRGAIEISGAPARLDLEPRWARLARDRGIKFTVSVDAHSIRGLDNLGYAVGLARRAGVRKTDVLNALGASEFAQAVRPGP